MATRPRHVPARRSRHPVVPHRDRALGDYHGARREGTMAVSATLARLNRRAINPLVRAFAGRLPPLALVIHRGRVSGRVYRTPVLAFPADDRFLVALFYGA